MMETLNNTYFEKQYGQMITLDLFFSQKEHNVHANKTCTQQEIQSTSMIGLTFSIIGSTNKSACT